MKTQQDEKSEMMKLSNYFKTIEDLAKKLGVDVDDLVNENSPGYESSDLQVKKEMLMKAKKRIQTLFEKSEPGEPGKDSTSNGLHLFAGNDSGK